MQWSLIQGLTLYTTPVLVQRFVGMSSPLTPMATKFIGGITAPIFLILACPDVAATQLSRQQMLITKTVIFWKSSICRTEVKYFLTAPSVAGLMAIYSTRMLTES
ncbi:hypothetical protein D3C76_1307950 [compost metagenome]